MTTLISPMPGSTTRGNAGLTATKGGRYLKFGGGGSPFDGYNYNGCIWPSKPANTNC